MAWNTSGGNVEASNVYYSHRSRSLSFSSSANIHTSRIKKNDYTPAHITLRRNGRRRINFHESWSLGWLLLLVASTENRNILILPHLNGTEQTRRRTEEKKCLTQQQHILTLESSDALHCWRFLSYRLRSLHFETESVRVYVKKESTELTKHSGNGKSNFNYKTHVNMLPSYQRERAWRYAIVLPLFCVRTIYQKKAFSVVGISFVARERERFYRWVSIRVRVAVFLFQKKSEIYWQASRISFRELGRLLCHSARKSYVWWKWKCALIVEIAMVKVDRRKESRTKFNTQYDK